MDWACQYFRWRGLMYQMTAAKSGRPATTIVASSALVEYMNTMINATLTISRMLLMMPLDNMSDTELT